MPIPSTDFFLKLACFVFNIIDRPIFYFILKKIQINAVFRAEHKMTFLWVTNNSNHSPYNCPGIQDYYFPFNTNANKPSADDNLTSLLSNATIFLTSDCGGRENHIGETQTSCSGNI